MKKKGLTLLAAMTMLAVGAVGGTLAWLTDTTQDVTNTFTTSGIDITLTETFNAKSDESKTENDIWKVQMVPGYEYTKDPVVTVKANSEDCYLFVKIVEENIPAGILEYTLNTTDSTTWSQLVNDNGDDVDGVYYTEVTSSTADKTFNLLKDNKVTISSEVGNKEMDKVTGNVSLTFTAYASQKHKNQTTDFTAYQAWTNVQAAAAEDDQTAEGGIAGN